MLYFILFLILLFFILFIYHEYVQKNEEFDNMNLLIDIDKKIMKPKKCFANNFCNGNKQSLCIENKCYPCGLQPGCSKDSDCGPNNCIDGCCDSL
jgi:hypothetical protein